MDGMAIDILPVDQQARANGLMWESKNWEFLRSVAAGIWIMSHYGYFDAIASFSLIVSIIILVPLLLRERPGEKLLPWTKGEASKAAEKIQLHSERASLKVYTSN